MIFRNIRCQAPRQRGSDGVEHARAAPIARPEHRSGITAALHWHRTPATGALIFLFLFFLPEDQ